MKPTALPVARAAAHDVCDNGARPASGREAGALTMAQRGYRVMDSDMHVQEPFSMWADYLGPAFCDRAPRSAHEDGTGP
jgi:hypothetical protein